MKLPSHLARRTVAAAAITSAAILLPAVALASSNGTSARPAAATRCARSELTSWIGVPGNGAAGSTYYELEISNISRHTCTLDGYPGVSALRGGRQLGSPAGRDSSHKSRLLTLTPNATVHVILQITDVFAYPSNPCRPTQATELRVFAPGDFSAIEFPFTSEACSGRGPVYLHVTTTIAGTGIPGYSN